jgi:hypothetical protein
MPTGPPGDPPQLEELLGEPWRAQVTQLRRYVRKTRNIGVAEQLSLAFEAVVGGDNDAAYRHLTDAGLLAAPQRAMRAEAADIAATFLAQWHREHPAPVVVF